MNILRIQNLSKSFNQTCVIDNIDLQVPERSIFGFIGANGAGKTTTMKMILGLLKPNNGEIWVCDEKVNFGFTPTNRHIGYLPDVPEFYNYMRPKEYLRLCGEITGLSQEKIKSRSNELLELVGLSKANKKIGGFSRGMKQRLGVAQALINEPKLLICDEPTSALDPIGRKEILDILQRIKGTTTVIFSTHILSDVERICDNAAVLNNGKIVLNGTLSEIKSRNKTNGMRLEFSTAADKSRFIEKSSRAVFLEGLSQTETTVALNVNNIPEVQLAVMQILVQNNILPLRLEILEPSIENLFMEAVK